ncbi:hypothetical protein LOC67_16440 [Stieleria sp. JC731]|uniref:efflux RND transporter periplasmic adaptor subunit n=1 Tax=Pirellulaceae TaxID=2691357 RepID=UPI001E3DD3BB|nr:HlyD family efflux transporter periplasmic adaptor subunit [Stieleria sp. JC731]MCC9602149.1 hypothetical protein [Stieleria sp. JC731]
MKKWAKTLVQSLVSAGILAASVAGFIYMGKPEVPTEPAAVPPVPIVETAVAAAHNGGISFDVDGVVVPFREIQLAAQVGGRVSFKSESCRIGKPVQKGEVLLRIEAADYELEVRRLTEELQQADAMIRELEAEITSVDNQIASTRQQLEIDQRLLQRNQDLLNRSAASSSEVDQARKSELTTRNSLQSLVDQGNLLRQRQVRMASAKSLVDANLEKAKLNLQRTEIRSPIDGIVVTESVEQDGYVQVGGIMIVLQDTSQLDVSCKLHMRQMNWLWQGQNQDNRSGSSDGLNSDGYEFPSTPATVVYQIGDRLFAWDAIVDRYEGAGIDAQTRMVPCRVHVDQPTKVVQIDSLHDNFATESLVSTNASNDQTDVASDTSSGGSAESDGQDNKASVGNTESINSQSAEIVADGNRPLHPPTLMTGMFVKVLIHADPPIPLVRIPQEAIQPGNKVWVVEDGMLQKKSVEVATTLQSSVIAYQRSNGLVAGDEIVVSPIATPVDGMEVKKASEIQEPAPRGSADNAGWKGQGGKRS